MSVQSEPVAAPSIWQIPKGDAHLTRKVVGQLAETYGRHSLMRWVLNCVVLPNDLDRRDPRQVALGIQAWVRKHIKFSPEPGENISTPGFVLRWRYGDCDDHSGLVAALLEAGRVRWRLMLLAKTEAGRSPLPFHIWVQAWTGAAWLDLETTDPRALPGEHPAKLMERVGIRL